MSAPEFSRTLRLDEIGGGRKLELVANQAECAALAERFNLISLESLEATLLLECEGDLVRANGQMRASALQSCIATGEAVPAQIDEDIALIFTPDPGHAPDSETELDGEDCDILYHDGKIIDFGEAAAQSFALALDPFPRSPGAEAALREAGVKSEEEERAASGPFAALAALRDKR